MNAEDKAQNSSAPGRGNLTASTRSIRRALRRIARLLDPWPGYAVPEDELLAVLAAERGEAEQPGQPRMGLDELLGRHRRLLAEPMRSLLSGEWLS